MSLKWQENPVSGYPAIFCNGQKFPVILFPGRINSIVY